MGLKEKKAGFGLEVRSFVGSDEKAYLVFKSREGSYHVFKEVEAKEAARECGASREGNTRQMWSEIWRRA
jgi:hypothetical protein